MKKFNGKIFRESTGTFNQLFRQIMSRRFFSIKKNLDLAWIQPSLYSVVI